MTHLWQPRHSVLNLLRQKRVPHRHPSAPPPLVRPQQVIYAVAGLIDLSAWPRLWAISKRDFLVMLISLCATLALGVLMGILCAILVSIVVFIVNSSQPRIVELGRMARTTNYRPIEAEERSTLDNEARVLPVPGVKILRFESPMFFANIHALCAAIADAVRGQLSVDNLSRKGQWKALALDMSCVGPAPPRHTQPPSPVTPALGHSRKAVARLAAASPPALTAPSLRRRQRGSTHRLRPS